MNVLLFYGVVLNKNRYRSLYEFTFKAISYLINFF